MSLRNTFKFVYFKTLDIFNVDKGYIKKIKKNNNIVILNLHRISFDINPFYPSLTPVLFGKLLNYVTKNFNVITFNDIESHNNSIKPNLILSFDDGFHDFLENAMPILKKYNVKVNLNVIPQCIESGIPVWDVMLGDILNLTPIEVVNTINLPDFTLKLNKTNKGEYGLALTRYFKQLNKFQREQLWGFFDKIAKDHNIKFTKMLNREEVKQVSKAHEIGVHSFSHESMGVESKQFFENDFRQCEEYFNTNFKTAMDIYAFPSGSYTNSQIKYLRDNGIKHILLVNENYSTFKANTYNRFTFYADSNSEVKMRAVGFKK